MRSRSWVVWVGALLGWTLIGLSFSINDYKFTGMLADYYAKKPSLPSLVLWDLVYWPTWAALTPLTVLIAGRFPLARNSWHPNLLINLAALLSLPLLQRLIYLLIALPIQKAIGEETSFLDPLLYNLPMGLMICGVILFVSHLINYLREEELLAAQLKSELAEEELQLSRLKADLIEARLHTLKMQLQPHFLFNALNSISAHLHENVNAADEMLARLGDFLRLTLKTSDVTVTLEEELEFLRSYLAIEKVRLEDGLQVREDIEPQTFTAQVPSLILQPSVENAIKHRQSFDQLQIVVSARREDGKLCIKIEDNGNQCQSNSKECEEGTGIKNTRARLESVFGSEYRFELKRMPDGSTAATLEMPFVTSAENVMPSIPQQ